MTARITTTGDVIQLDSAPQPDEIVTEQDAGDVSKLSRLLVRLLSDVAALKRRFWPQRIDYESVAVDASGITKYRFAHGLGGRVRWSVVDWQPSYERPGEQIEQGIVERSKSIGTWNNFGAGDFTVGTRWQLKRARAILGIRFVWRTDGNSHSTTAKLWRDSDGALLRTATVTTLATGVYEAFFSTPITDHPVASNFTLGIRTGTDHTYTNDTTWAALVALDTGPDLQLQNQALDSAGDARPTSAAAAGVAYIAEPILEAVTNEPAFMRDSSTDDGTLVLRSFVKGTVTIRVEAAG